MKMTGRNTVLTAAGVAAAIAIGSISYQSGYARGHQAGYASGYSAPHQVRLVAQVTPPVGRVGSPSLVAALEAGCGGSQLLHVTGNSVGTIVTAPGAALILPKVGPFFNLRGPGQCRIYLPSMYVTHGSTELIAESAGRYAGQPVETRLFVMF